MTYEQVADDKTPAEIDTYLDVQVSGRMMRIPVSPLIDLSTLTPGMTVLGPTAYIDEAEQFEQLLAKLDRKRTLVLLVKRGGEASYVPVRPQ